MRKSLEKIAKSLIPAVALAGSFLHTGCSMTPVKMAPEKEKQLIEQVEYKDVILGEEGIQPLSGNRIEKLVEDVGHDQDMAHGAISFSMTDEKNYRSLMPVVLKAAENQKDVYLVGYSSSAKPMMQFARECGKYGIHPYLILLDPTTLGRHGAGFREKIPAVKDLHIIYSNSPEWVGGQEPKYDDLEDKNVRPNISRFETNHLSLPEVAKAKIKEIIQSNQNAKAS